MEKTLIGKRAMGLKRALSLKKRAVDRKGTPASDQIPSKTNQDRKQLMGKFDGKDDNKEETLNMAQETRNTGS